MKKIKQLSLGLISMIMMITSATIPSLFTTTVSADIETLVEDELILHQTFTDPVVEDNEDFLTIRVDEAKYSTNIPDWPLMPVFSKTFELPWGSKISDIDFEISNVESKKLNEKISTVSVHSLPAIQSNDIKQTNKILVEENPNSYPLDWYLINTGVGINKVGENVLFVNLKIYPVRYISLEDKIEFINDFKIKIDYKHPNQKTLVDSTYDMVIISPYIFEEGLQPLINHKNSYGIKTNLVNLDYIYDNFQGRDEPEKIKYFIKYAFDEWQIKYVLLVGDIKKLPIRSADSYPWNGFGNDILTDLYYADIYNDQFEFSTWDANENDTFGEATYNYNSWPPQAINSDEVDLYADVYIGRMPCRNEKELDIVVNKIIDYEINTYGADWFKKIIVAGGDTFSIGIGSPPFRYEGEITNKKVLEQLPDFDHVKLWASKHRLGPFWFNLAINLGAGFVSYAGHGFEHGWGTYRPNSFRNKMGPFQPKYFTPHIQKLKNREKLPIIFFDACLTAKLDFNMSTFETYFPAWVKLLKRLTGVDYDPTNYYTCFAWAFLIKQDGGAIATIGATRPAYSMVDFEAPIAGAGILDIEFFKAYEDGISLGEMFTRAQQGYIDVVGEDYFTIEEYMIIGDPSLKVGGYP